MKKLVLALSLLFALGLVSVNAQDIKKEVKKAPAKAEVVEPKAEAKAEAKEAAAQKKEVKAKAEANADTKEAIAKKKEVVAKAKAETKEATPVK